MSPPWNLPSGLGYTAREPLDLSVLEDGKCYHLIWSSTPYIPITKRIEDTFIHKKPINELS